MRTYPIQSPNFGKLYYGSGKKGLTNTQKDVLQDINDVLEENNYVKRLEDLKYDVYIEPNNDGYAMDIAFFKNTHRLKNGKLTYEKIILMGSYIADTIFKYTGQMQDYFTTDRLKDRFYKFFKNDSYGKYKRHVNHL